MNKQNQLETTCMSCFWHMVDLPDDAPENDPDAPQEILIGRCRYGKSEKYGKAGTGCGYHRGQESS